MTSPSLIELARYLIHKPSIVNCKLGRHPQHQHDGTCLGCIGIRRLGEGGGRAMLGEGPGVDIKNTNIGLL